MSTVDPKELAVTPPDGEGKIEFTPEQQAYINNTLIKDAMGRAGKEARLEAERLRTEMAEVNLKLKEAQDAARKATTRSGDETAEAIRKEFEDIAKGLKTEAENLRKEAADKAKEAADARKETQRLRKRHAITSAAQKNKFHDLDAVIKLTEDVVEWDDERNRFIVRGEDGSIRHNSAMQHMSLDEFYTEYAAKKPWLTDGTMKSGASSSESTITNRNMKYSVEEIFGPKADATKAMKLKKEDPAGYARLRAIAKEGGILA